MFVALPVTRKRLPAAHVASTGRTVPADQGVRNLTATGVVKVVKSTKTAVDTAEYVATAGVTFAPTTLLAVCTVSTRWHLDAATVARRAVVRSVARRPGEHKWPPANLSDNNCALMFAVYEVAHAPSGTQEVKKRMCFR